MEMYCVKCRAKTGTRDIQQITMKNGSPAAQGFCMECGTKKFRIGGVPVEA